jgi:hypothetical protein
LKGSLAISEEAADLDVGSYRGNAREFRNRNLKVLEGRTTNAANALETLVLDLGEASTAAAESDFKATLYEYVTDNQEALGAQIRTWRGTPKQGYTREARVRGKDGKMKVVERFSAELPSPKNGFVYSNGLEHFEVVLPEGSQLDRGVKGLKAVVTPGKLDATNPVGSLLRGVGTATNVLARSYTTWAPEWQLMVGFVRDIQTLPTTIGVQAFDSPWKARVFFTQYGKNLIRNTLDLKNGALELKALAKGNRADIKAYAEANPQSYVAKLLAYRAAGGSTEFSQGLNRENAGELVFDKARKKDADLLSWETAVQGYDKWNQVTGDWAALLENKGRVAAWDALQAAGKTPQEAAALVKASLDYGQSGEWGRMINLWHAFYRIGATSADSMRRAFTTPTGQLDKPKLAKWMPFFGAMGAVNYMLMAAILGDDEDGVPRIKKLSPETLVSKMIAPDGEGGMISAAIGLGVPQLTLTPGVLAAAVANEHMTVEEAGKAYYDVITKNTPIQPIGQKEGSGAVGFANSWLQGLLVPTVGKPIGELYSNVNAFDRPIRTDFPSKDKFKSDQGMPDTPQWWKDQAKELRELTGGVIDIYPESIRHFTKAYGGQPANTIIRHTLDLANKEEQGVDSQAVRTALRLGVNDEAFYYRNESRKAMTEFSISKRRLESAKQEGQTEDKWLRANPDDAKRLAARKELDKAQDAYYKRKAAIRDNKLMSAEGKKSELKKADGKLREAVNKAQAVIEATE